MRIPSAPPDSPAPLARRLIEPVALSPVGTWYLKKLAPGLDRALDRLTGGRLTSVPVIPILLLKHVGARSGRARVTPLVYFTDGDDVIVMASNYGGQKHPAWYYNVKANPEVRLRAHGREGRYRARITEGAERKRLWDMAQQLTRAYTRYETTAGARTINVIACSPLDPA
jgi:deazaflavin-dependent oxidoreductase (nitroreductase family)